MKREGNNWRSNNYFDLYFLKVMRLLIFFGQYYDVNCHIDRKVFTFYKWSEWKIQSLAIIIFNWIPMLVSKPKNKCLTCSNSNTDYNHRTIRCSFDIFFSCNFTENIIDKKVHKTYGVYKMLSKYYLFLQMRSTLLPFDLTRLDYSLVLRRFEIWLNI